MTDLKTLTPTELDTLLTYDSSKSARFGTPIMIRLLHTAKLYVEMTETMKKKKGWLAGWAECPVCDHEWVIVLPPWRRGSELECPKCQGEFAFVMDDPREITNENEGIDA